MCGPFFIRSVRNTPILEIALDANRGAVKVAASIVTYNPELPQLRALIASIDPQVDMVVVVDNASRNELAENLNGLSENIEVIQLSSNAGVATAHNAAIARATSQGCSHVLFLDQDSVPDQDMVKRLLEVECHAVQSNRKVAAIGPRYYDPRHNQPAPFIRLDGLKINKIDCDGYDQVVEVDYLITSGSLIRLDTLRDVGLMDDSLFIDYVDIEWCLRAKSKGYQSYGVCAAGMCHSLGDEVVSWGGRTISVRTPLRNYYLFRNAFLLYKRPYISWVWIANDAVRLLLKLGFFTLITPPRCQNLAMMFRGMWDGLLGRSGPFRV